MNEAKLWFWILMNALLVVVIVMIVAVAMPALVTYSKSFYPARTISVTAEGKTTATPDLAVIDLSVTTEGKNPQDLSSMNTDKMNAVLQFIAAQNIATSDTKTTGYNLAPNYQYDQTTNRSFITDYTLTQTVEIKVRDLSNAATIIGGLAPLGVNQIGGINFTFDDPDSFVAIARADALNKAKQQAMTMASEAGVTLGDVLSVSESSNLPSPSPVYDYGEAKGMSTAASTPDIQPGSSDITDDVTVTYSLR